MRWFGGAPGMRLIGLFAQAPAESHAAGVAAYGPCRSIYPGPPLQPDNAPNAEYLLVRRDVCDQVRALRSSCSARRQRPPWLARPASDDDLPLPQVDVARLGVLRVVADRGQPRAGCSVAARRRLGGRPGLGPSPRGYPPQIPNAWGHAAGPRLLRITATVIKVTEVRSQVRIAARCRPRPRYALFRGAGASGGGTAGGAAVTAPFVRRHLFARGQSAEAGQVRGELGVGMAEHALDGIQGLALPAGAAHHGHLRRGVTAPLRRGQPGPQCRAPLRPGPPCRPAGSRAGRAGTGRPAGPRPRPRLRRRESRR